MKITKKKKARGGVRPGAGRPVTPGIPVGAVRVSAEVMAEARASAGAVTAATAVALLAEDGLVLRRLVARGVVTGALVAAEHAALRAPRVSALTQPVPHTATATAG